MFSTKGPFQRVSSQESPNRLYHCVLGCPLGDSLEPRTLREVNGRSDHYLFASHVLSKSLAFAFSYMKQEILLNAAVPGSKDEIALVFDRENVMNRNRQITVYEFDSV